MTTLKTPPARTILLRGATLLKARPGRSRVMLVAALIALIVEFAGNSTGLWLMTLAAGVVAGAMRRKGAISGLVLGTVLAWGLGILMEGGGRTLQIAGVVSALALGTRGLGVAIVILAFVYALLLALAGAWLGAAGRRLLAGRRPAESPADYAGEAPRANEAGEAPHADEEEKESV
ncbi:MAG: hypothetical protein ACM3ML_05200 [Micromonosporaceae bacterium]